MGDLSASIFALIEALRQHFSGRLWYTMAMPDKIALITGSSSGFRAADLKPDLAKAGFRVVATMRDLGRRERLDQAARAANVADRIDVRALDVTQFDGPGGIRGRPWSAIMRGWMC